MDKQKNPLMILGILLLSIIFIVLAGRSSRFDVYFAIVLFLCAILIPFLIRKKVDDWFEIIYLYSAFYFITFGIRTIYLLWFPEGEGRAALNISDVMATAVIYAIIGYVAFLIGYSLPLAKKLSLGLPQLASIGMPKIRLFIYLIYPIGVMGRLLLIARGWYLSHEAHKFTYEIPAYFGVVGYSQYLSLFAFTLALLLLFSHGRKSGLFFYFWCFIAPFEIIWVLLVGSKHAFFPLLFLPLAAWNYAKGGIKLKYFIIPLLIFIFVVFPFVGAYRTVAKYGDMKIATFEDDFRRIMNRTKDVARENLISDFFNNSIGVFMERFNGVDSFSYVIMNTPYPVEFQHGRTIVGTLAIFIPKFIWPDKDALLAESMRQTPVLFGGHYAMATGGLGITLPAELYWNFQVPGIIVGMFLVGIFNRFFYLYFCRRENFVGISIYISQLSYLIFVEGWLFHTYQNVIKQVVIFLCLMAIFTGGKIFSKKGEA